MEQDKTADKFNPVLPLDIERERELFETNHRKSNKWPESSYKTYDLNGLKTYLDSSTSLRFDDWLACASVPRPVPAEPAKEPIARSKIIDSDYARDFIFDFHMRHFNDKTFKSYIIEKMAGDFAFHLAKALEKIEGHKKESSQPIGQAWGIWCSGGDQVPHWLNYAGVLNVYNDNEVDQVLNGLLGRDCSPWKYEKRPFYIYDAPQPVVQASPNINLDALAGLVSDRLRGHYWCNRVWSAWSYGTMGEEDFSPSEESEVVNEIVDAVMALIGPSQPAQAPAAPDIDPSYFPYEKAAKLVLRAFFRRANKYSPEFCPKPLSDDLPIPINLVAAMCTALTAIEFESESLNNSDKSAPQIQPNTWLPSEYAPNDGNLFDAWFGRHFGRWKDCRYTMDGRLVSASKGMEFPDEIREKFTHFMVVNPPFDSDKQAEPKPQEAYPRCRNYLREQGLPRERKCEVCGFGKCMAGK